MHMQFLAGVVYGWEEIQAKRGQRNQAQTETIDANGAFGPPVTDDVDPNCIWPQPGSETEYSFGPRDGAYSLPSDDCIEAPKATAAEATYWSHPLEPSNMIPQEDALDDSNTGSSPHPSPKSSLSTKSSPSTASSQLDDTAPTMILNPPHENNTETPAVRPAVSSTEAVKHEPAHPDTSAVPGQTTKCHESLFEMVISQRALAQPKTWLPKIETVIRAKTVLTAEEKLLLRNLGLSTNMRVLKHYPHHRW